MSSGAAGWRPQPTHLCQDHQLSCPPPPNGHFQTRHPSEAPGASGTDLRRAPPGAGPLAGCRRHPLPTRRAARTGVCGRLPPLHKEREFDPGSLWPQRRQGGETWGWEGTGLRGGPGVTSHLSPGPCPKHSNFVTLRPVSTSTTGDARCPQPCPGLPVQEAHLGQHSPSTPVLGQATPPALSQPSVPRVCLPEGQEDSRSPKPGWVSLQGL